MDAEGPVLATWRAERRRAQRAGPGDSRGHGAEQQLPGGQAWVGRCSCRNGLGRPETRAGMPAAHAQAERAGRALHGTRSSQARPGSGLRQKDHLPFACPRPKSPDTASQVFCGCRHINFSPTKY